MRKANDMQHSLNKYLIVGASDFEMLNATCDTEFGFPNQFAQTYSEPIIHPNDSDKYLFVVEPRVVAFLSDAQKAELLSEIPSDWQSVPELES